MVATAALLHGQAPRSFTHEPATFITELGDFFDEIRIRDNKQAAQEAHRHFAVFWQTGSFSEEQRQLIYQTTDLMLQRRLRSFPEMAQYLQTLNAFIENEVLAENLDVWLQSMHDALDASRNTRMFTTRLDFTNNFLRSGVLYESRIFTWFINSPDFTFHNDSAFYVAFQNINLVCTTRNDTTMIHRTSGRYYPDNQRWVGTDGRINWQRFGFSDNEVYATLDTYEIDLTSSTFEIYPVAFYHTKYFRGGLSGKLTERASTNAVNPESTRYPRFDSDISDLYISNIFNEIDYQGGFSMRGAKVYGGGDDQRRATITFRRPFRDQTGSYDLLTVRSNDFIISPDRIAAETAAITINHQEDSITHAGLQFRYTDHNREVTLLRIRQGIEQSPYFNSFHEVEIDVEAIYWQMDQEHISLGNMRGLQNQSNATFLSNNFFAERKFDHLQGIDRVHPLSILHNYSATYNTRRFNADQMASFMRMPVSQVELQLIRLATLGFLHYDVERRQGIMTDKVEHYLFAKNRRSDFDVINFVSQVNDRTNAVLQLENFDLKLRGVPDVSISNAKNVSIIPDNGEVILRKNRDFLFSGNIKAGLFEFDATDCFFNYDTFKLNMPNVDNMRFKVRSFEADQFGQRRLVDVKTAISDISGDMLIDLPDNKSGIVHTPRFPIFNSNTGSYIYFDQLPENELAYNRELFHYYVEPFALESLEEFATEDIRFDGHLISGGILPDPIEEPLVVMRDYSLGFDRKTTAEGYDIYRGKGKFFDDLSLSYTGLRGSGRIDYLNSTSLSPHFMFYLDSVNASQVEFEVMPKKTASAEFPSAKGFNLNQHWQPYSDEMELTTNDIPLAVFDNRAELTGSLLFTPEKMTAGGKLDFLNATAHAEKFEFLSNAFRADTTKLVLRDMAVSDVVFNTENYRAFVDLDTKTGNFKTNDVSSKIDLPFIRYISFLNEFDWYFDRNEVELYSYAKADISGYDTLTMADLINKPMPGARFISVHPLHDSLYFYSPRANYNLSDNILTARGVELIKVADAAVFPEDGLLEIHENAAIQPLIGATIIADTINKNHVITGATVNIESGYAYKASGQYAFANEIAEVQHIFFDLVTVDTSYQTIASGEIAEVDRFEFSPRFGFKGKVNLEASNPLLYFDGGYKVLQNCDSAFIRWVEFEQHIDPENLILPVNTPINEYGHRQLYAGLFHSNENNRVYPAFLSRRGYYSDSLLFSVNGHLKARRQGTELLIADSSQMDIDDDEEPGAPFISWNIDRCVITSRGKMTFGHDLGDVKMDVFGQADHFIVPDSTQFNTVLSVDFLFSDEALAIMAEDLQLANKPAFDMTGTMIREAFDNMLGKDESERVFTDLGLYGSIRRIPDALKKNFIFANVKMTYHSDSRSFISEGPIGVVMIQGKPVFKYFDGHIQLIRRRSGDVLNIYIEIDRPHWYFFTHRGNLLQTASSRTDYNKTIEDINPSRRRERGAGETAYRFMLTDGQARNRFIRDMRQFENE